jgi:peptide/nickel transport system substrate-binding protein
MSRNKLNIGVHYEPSGIDPHIGSAELSLQMTNAVFDTLVNKTSDGRYLKGLAESFEISADECSYTFRLQRNVKFHDGTPFNATAVAFSLQRAYNPENRSQLAKAMLGPYQGCRIIDEHILEVKLVKPYALFLDAVSQGWLAPVSPAAVAKYGNDFSRNPVGTGPYTFDQWLPGERIILKRNDKYRWGPPLVKNRGPAYLEEISFVFLPDDSERTIALESGTVDVVFYVSPTDATRLRKNERYIVRTWPILGIPVCMMMNTIRAPTNELKVRQAINYAVDQTALIDKVFRGEFARAYGPVSQFTLGYAPSVEDKYPYDPNMAKQLLDEAGWMNMAPNGVREKNGNRLKLFFYALPVNFYPEFGKIITKQLVNVGIDVEVVLLNPIDWIRAGMRGDHHLIPQGKYGSSAQLLSFIYHSKHSGPNGYGWSKRTASHHHVIDELLEQAEQTLSIEKFVPLYQQAQDIIMDEALIVPLHCNANVVASRIGIDGIQFDAIGAYPLFHDTVISDENAVD